MVLGQLGMDSAKFLTRIYCLVQLRYSMKVYTFIRRKCKWCLKVINLIDRLSWPATYVKLCSPEFPNSGVKVTGCWKWSSFRVAMPAMAYASRNPSIPLAPCLFPLPCDIFTSESTLCFPSLYIMHGDFIYGRAWRFSRTAVRSGQRSSE
jgi:hypothetical protein